MKIVWPFALSSASCSAILSEGGTPKKDTPGCTVSSTTDIIITLNNKLTAGAWYEVTVSVTATGVLQ